jgi:solute carrier family 8 (sodium/calcium exchanger)
MALGSSAPEILLSVVETCGKLGKPAGELGPSTIVGSASFNLLFISAVCIPSVDAPKKIKDMGVFITTAIFSLFAYVWLFICIKVNSPGYVTTGEAYFTLSFMVLLLVMAFGADKMNQRKEAAATETDEIEEEKNKEAMAVKKTFLRDLAKKFGDEVVIEVAQGLQNDMVTYD